MSELQTEREFNVDAGCSIVITSLNGEEQIEIEIKETTPFTLLEKELKRVPVNGNTFQMFLQKCSKCQTPASFSGMN